MRKATLLFLIAIIVYSLFRNRYFYVPDIHSLRDTSRYKLHEVIKVSQPYRLGVYSSNDLGSRIMYKDSSEDIYIYISQNKDSNSNYHRIELYKMGSNLELNRIEKAPNDLKPLFFTDFISGDDDEDFVVRNNYRFLSAKAKNPKVLQVKKEYYLPYLIKNFWDIFCWSLSPFDCSPYARKAEYTCKVYLNNGSLKFSISGNDSYSHATFFYINNPQKDSVAFIRYGNKIMAIESL